MRTPGLPLLGLMLGASFALSAQENLEEESRALQMMQRLMETQVEVSASHGMNLFDAPSTVSFLDRDFLLRYGVRTLAEAVELVAGMAVVRSGLRTDLATSRGVLQENYGNRVLMLIDGVSTWMALSGDPVLSRVDIHDVERIEILKGPASVLYGSNAYAGAVNIVLRKEGRNRAQLHAGLSDRGGHALGAHQDFLWRDLRGFLSFNSTTVQGDRQTFLGEDQVPIPLEDFRGDRNLNLQLGGEGHAFLFNTFESRYPHLGNGIRRSGGGGRTWVEQGYLAHYGFKGGLGSDLRWSFSALHDSGHRLFDSSLNGSLQFRILAYRRNLGLTLGSRTATPLDWEVGVADELRKSVYDQSFNPATGATISDSGLLGRGVGERSAFAQATWTWDRWSCFLGTRYTKNENFGSNLASRATLLFRLAPQHSLKLIWGQSYRSPTLLEQYLILPGVLVGNPKARPETSDTVEVEYLFGAGPWFVQAQAYAMTLKDKLFRGRRYPDFTSDPTDITVTYINGNRFHTQGLELELKVQPGGGFDAFLDLNYIHGDHGDALPALRGTNYQFVPMASAKAGFSRTFGAFTASLLGLFQTRVDGPLQPLPSWGAWSLHLGYLQAWNRLKVRHSLDAKNLGDRERYFPENARRNLNAIPEGMGRILAYALQANF